MEWKMYHTCWWAVQLQRDATVQWTLCNVEVRDPRESGSQEEDPQGAICMHLSCTPPEFCLVTLSIREHDHGA